MVIHIAFSVHLAYINHEGYFNSLQVGYNRKISIYVLDLCNIKGNKVKFQERLLFRESSIFFWHSFCPERSVVWNVFRFLCFSNNEKKNKKWVKLCKKHIPFLYINSRSNNIYRKLLTAIITKPKKIFIWYLVIIILTCRKKNKPTPLRER